jgi:hypothetical protein
MDGMWTRMLVFHFPFALGPQLPHFIFYYPKQAYKDIQEKRNKGDLLYIPKMREHISVIDFWAIPVLFKKMVR